MNALSLYIKTCRNVLQLNADDGTAWLETQRLLSYLRQEMACSACGRLLVAPLSSATCPHSICKNCLETKSKFGCKDCEDFEENQQTAILLQCYRKLCEFLLYQRKYFNGGTNVELNALVQEGASYRADYRYQGAFLGNNNSDSEDDMPTNDNNVPIVANGNASGYGILASNVKRSRSPASLDDLGVDKPEHEQGGPSGSSRYKAKRQGCRCGMATPNPGKLTCCGQRCPCYVGNKACFTCRCRGCRNPHRVNAADRRAVAAESDSSEQSSDCDI